MRAIIKPWLTITTISLTENKMETTFFNDVRQLQEGLGNSRDAENASAAAMEHSKGHSQGYADKSEHGNAAEFHQRAAKLHGHAAHNPSAKFGQAYHKHMEAFHSGLAKLHSEHAK